MYEGYVQFGHEIDFVHKVSTFRRGSSRNCLKPGVHNVFRRPTGTNGHLHEINNNFLHEIPLARLTLGNFGTEKRYRKKVFHVLSGKLHDLFLAMEVLIFLFGERHYLRGPSSDELHNLK